MQQKIVLLCLFILAIPAAAGGAEPVLAKTPPIAEIHNIYEYCRKTKTDPAVTAKMKKLGLNLGGDIDRASRYFEPVLSMDYRLIGITLNPQTYQTIQGITLFWKKDPGLSYETIQQLTGLRLPERGAKEIRISDPGYVVRFYILGHENALHPELTQVTFTCSPGKIYDQCWQIDIACYGFVHAD